MRIVKNLYPYTIVNGLGGPAFIANATSTLLPDGFRRIESTADSHRCFFDHTFNCVSGRRYAARMTVRNVSGLLKNRVQYRSSGTATITGVGTWIESNITSDCVVVVQFDCTASGTSVIRVGLNVNSAGGIHPVSCEIGELLFSEIPSTQSVPAEFVPPGLTYVMTQTRNAANVGGFLVDGVGTADWHDATDAVMIFGDSFSNDPTDWPQLLFGDDDLRKQKAIYVNAVSGRKLETAITTAQAQLDLSAFNLRNLQAYPQISTLAARPKTVIVASGVNDIVSDATLADMQARFAAMNTICSQNGVQRTLWFDIPPFSNNASWTEGREAVRAAYNTWLETACGTGTVRLFKISDVLKDGADATDLAAAYDSGDGLHPNATGSAAIAAAVEAPMFWGWSAWTPFDSTLPALTLSPDAPGKLRSVQTWSKVDVSKQDIEKVMK